MRTVTGAPLALAVVTAADSEVSSTTEKLPDTLKLICSSMITVEPPESPPHPTRAKPATSAAIAPV